MSLDGAKTQTVSQHWPWEKQEWEGESLSSILPPEKTNKQKNWSQIMIIYKIVRSF